VSPWESGAWDAWAGALRGEAEDAAHLRRELAGAGAGKSADRVRDVRELVERFRSAYRTQALPDAAGELCRQGAARSAEQSCAAPVGRAVQPEVRADAALPLEAAVRQTRQWAVSQGRLAAQQVVQAPAGAEPRRRAQELLEPQREVPAAGRASPREAER